MLLSLGVHTILWMRSGVLCAPQHTDARTAVLMMRKRSAARYANLCPAGALLAEGAAAGVVDGGL